MKNLMIGNKVALSLTVRNVLTIAILALLILYFGFFLWHSATQMFFPEQFSYRDPYILKQIELLTQGKNIYSDIQRPPYIAGIYGPLYLIVTAFFAKLFGLSYFWPRLVALIPALLVGLLVFLIVYRATQKPLAGAIASLLLFASHYFYSWIPFARADSLALLFSVSAIYVIHRSHGLSSTLLAALLAILAVYTRQTAVAAPAAILLYLLLNDRPRGTLFFLSCLVPALLVMAAMNYLMEGQFFQHLVVYNTQPWSLLEGAKMYYKLLTTYPIVIALAGYHIFRIVTDRGSSLFVIWLFTTVLVSVTVAKDGAGINYFLELFTVMAILVGMTLGSLSPVDLHQKTLVLMLLVIQVVGIFHMPGLPEDIQTQRLFRQFIPAARPFTASEMAEREQVLSIMHETPGKKLVWTGDFLTQAYERNIDGVELPPDPLINHFLDGKVVWDPTIFQDRLASKEFTVIITRGSAEFDDYGYQMSYAGTLYDVWKPKTT